LAVQLSLNGKPGSPLGKDIQALAQQSSTFGSLSGLAFQAGLNLALPADLKDAFAAVIDEGFAKAVEKEKDPTKKELARKVFAVLGPTLKAGRLDVAAGLRGPDAAGHYTGFACVKVKDSSSIQQLAKELAPMLPEKARPAIQFDAETINGTKVHAVKPPEGEVPSDARRVFGDTPSALIAFPPGAVVFTVGADPSGVIKSLLESRSPRPAPPFTLEAAIGRLAPLDKNSGPVAKQVADEVFGQGRQGQDLVRITVEGGSSLKVRATMKAQLIRYGVKVKEKAEGGQ
jgi:hypothetical protein